MNNRFLQYGLQSCLLTCIALASCSVQAEQNAAAVLQAKYASLEQQLQHNQFRKALVLDSSETANRTQGDIYGVLDYPLATVHAGLSSAGHWCDVMILHMNTKYCHAVTSPSGTIMQVNIGKKTPQTLADVARVEFKFQVAAAAQDYFEIKLQAKDGPMGTSDYRILLAAVALPHAKTFIHLSYSYANNFAGRLAMRTYLATVGSAKVGFTVLGKQPDGQPEYVRGVRGVVERNTMRYFLAIDSYLAAAGVAPAAQQEQRFQLWYTAIERYPRQLHEMERSDYLEMKRSEYARQQTVQ